MSATLADVFVMRITIGKSFVSVAIEKTRHDVANVGEPAIFCEASFQAFAAGLIGSAMSKDQAGESGPLLDNN
jgi:hypothetical protein